VPSLKKYSGKIPIEEQDRVTKEKSDIVKLRTELLKAYDHAILRAEKIISARITGI